MTLFPVARDVSTEPYMQPDQPLPPQQMMGLITGYWRTQAAGVAATVAIADRLADGAKTVAALAETRVHELALFEGQGASGQIRAARVDVGE
jgi:hypothetical protein